MNNQVKIQENQKKDQLIKTNSSNKGRSGRWTQKEVALFQVLLQRYGKNWKKIQQHLSHRSLQQIRSHAQKHFSKIGHEKVEHFQRRAKLLQALEILKDQNYMKQGLLKKHEPQRQRDEPSQQQSDKKQAVSKESQSSPKIHPNSESLQNSIKFQAPQNNSTQQAPIFYTPNLVFPLSHYDPTGYYFTLMQLQHQYLLSNNQGME